MLNTLWNAVDLLNKERTMGFKIEKDVPLKKANFRTPFTQALDKLLIGDTITGLSRDEVYKYRSNFYTAHFKDRKFQFWKDATSKRYCVQRVS